MGIISNYMLIHITNMYKHKNQTHLTVIVVFFHFVLSPFCSFVLTLKKAVSTLIRLKQTLVGKLLPQNDARKRADKSGLHI